jgi:hypothetical protein
MTVKELERRKLRQQKSKNKIEKDEPKEPRLYDPLPH